MNDPHPKDQPKDHSVRDLLRELFPETHRELFGPPSGSDEHPESDEHRHTPMTLGLYPVADGRLALVQGAHLAEFTPIDPKGKNALHCDLCHYTRSRSEAAVFRVSIGPRRSRYVTLCLPTGPCQRRAGRQGLENLAGRIFPLEPAHMDDH